MDRIAEYVTALTHSDHFRSQVAAYHVIPGQPAQVRAIAGSVTGSMADLLMRLGYDALYTHQFEALSSIAAGRHTVVSTPTASGKTLIYNVPLFEAVARNPQARALYIFPLKALAQDQLATLDQWAAMAGPQGPVAAVYDGDTNAYQRRKIRQKPPNVLFTNPEMVHLSLLAYHDKWEMLFRHLRLVVIDEVHTYRGMLGSQMAQVLRRLHRVCGQYGAAPTFVFTSATVANPGQLSAQLAGVEVHTILESGAPRGERHVVLIDPDDGAAQAAIALLKAALARELRTIVYTQSRKMAELIAIWVQQRAGKWSERISVYRAGLLPQDRRGIEQRLKSGELLAVVSTSALELGIDIGDLDLCVLVGYPGSMIATWQRGGRVGRQGQSSALILLAGENALDKYFMANPKAFWQGEAETAVINPANRVAVETHLECAAAELPLEQEEHWLAQPGVAAAVARLETQGVLRRTADGRRIYARRRRPHLSVNLRGGGDRYRIVDAASGLTIGEVDGYRLYRDTHPGAIYLHQGETYLVQAVDLDQHAVRVIAARVDYYTRVRSETDVQVMAVQAHRRVGQTRVSMGQLNVTDRVTAYDQVKTATGQTLMQHPLAAPPSSFETHGIWFDIPASLCRQMVSKGHDLMGALHAAEHAAISMMPLLVLADRNDLGGLSTMFHPAAGQAAIFIYDGVPGGAGFCEQAFDRAEQLLQHTQQAIEQCACKSGCPACVHSPKCGSGNHPIDKQGAAALIALMRRNRPPRPGDDAAMMPVHPSVAARATPRKKMGYGVFDLETQRSAQEVGGWHQAHRMKVSCGVVYDARTDRFDVYPEAHIDALIEHLQALDLVVGFNSKRFDYKVLSGYSDFNFHRLPSLDLLEAVHRQLGFRLSLDHLAEATLGVNKNGSGLDALRWWQEGRMDKIIDYCRMDVRITRDLYLFARDNGYLLYRERGGTDLLRVPVGTSFDSSPP